MEGLSDCLQAFQRNANWSKTGPEYREHRVLFLNSPQLLNLYWSQYRLKGGQVWRHSYVWISSRYINCI